MADVFSKIKSGSLYDLLVVCSAEDLDPLVAYIIGKLLNSLESSETYKAHSPDHTKYTKLIADEIRLYGGNSLRNRVRRGEGPDYDQILFDVCQKIGIPAIERKEDVIDNEYKLLKSCLPYRWEGLKSSEIESAVEKARQKYSKKFGLITTTGVGTAFGIARGVLVAETTLLGAISTIAAPVGAALIVKGFTDPAFDVTIPCVIHIAYLRWKILQCIEKIDIKNPFKIANVISSSEMVLKRDIPLIIGEEVNTPLFSFAVAEISKTMPIKWQPTSKLDSTGVSRLNPLLQAVPNLVIQANVATTQYVEVNVQLSALARAKDSLNGMRGYVMGSDGRLTEHAQLFAPDNLQKIVNVGALWQIASVIVAQKHLADISQKLTEIKKEVEDIRQHQEDVRESNMEGAIDYFNQIAPAILAGKFSDAHLNQIESNEKDLLSTINHLLKDLKKLNNEIENIESSDFGTEGIKNAIEKHQQKLSGLYNQLFLCIRARICGWQLLSAFPENEDVVHRRKQSIDESLTQLDVNGELVKQTIIKMDEKIRSLDSFFNKSLTINERKLELLKWQDKFIEEVTNNTFEIDRNIRSVESWVQDKQDVTKLLLKIEDGKVVATSPI